MRLAIIVLVLCAAFAASVPAAKNGLPDGFTALRQLAPDIIQDMRYAGSHNFMGRPVKGYEGDECILTEKAAKALAGVQAELAASGLGLKVYDCYRPTRSVADFVAWGKDQGDQVMKDEFYPRVDKAKVFELGYIAERSSHSRGSTVDLTIVALPAKSQADWKPGMPLVDCAAPYTKRFADNSLDFGTGYDCFDERSHPANTEVGSAPKHLRELLAELMTRHGFKGIKEEWWHFTLKDEPFPKKDFDFPVRRVSP